MSMFWHGLVVCTCVVIVLSYDLESRVINIDQGPVRGYKPPDGEYFVYFGIPYATEPKGIHKFKAPLPAPIWNETLEAVQSNVFCSQGSRNLENEDNQNSDNCLIANIYVPETDVYNLPVYVNFHGGAFQVGHGEAKTPIKLIESKKIIFVTFNYRLGPQGFLCLGTEGIPGNAGLKDQVALLRWVRKNIAGFGGNPNDVTIGGCSAGGASVDLISISKLTKGLFNKVIIQSGPNCASFSVQNDPTSNAKMVARSLNFENVDDVNALEDFYKNIPLSVLHSVPVANRTDSGVIFAPCVELDIGQEMVLDDYPANILKRSDYVKLPTLYGMTNMEGIFRVGYFKHWNNLMNQNFSDFLPDDLNFRSEKDKEEVIQKVKHLYFGDQPVSEKNILGYVNYFTDVMFGYGTTKSVRLQIEAGNKELYLYKYSFVDDGQNNIPYTNISGASHCDQNNAVMDSHDENNLSERYKQMKAIMRDLWLNFITTGKPVLEDSPYPSWPPVRMDTSPYMLINGSLELKSSSYEERSRLWDEIYRQHFKHPVPPYHKYNIINNKSFAFFNNKSFAFKKIYFLNLRLNLILFT